MTQAKLMQKLNKDVEIIEYKINNLAKYNFEMNLKRYIAKIGLSINHLLPFIFSSIILFNCIDEKNKPFIIGEVEKKLKIYSMKTSTGYSEERHADYSDTSFYTDTFCYTTPWEKNSDDLFERTITYYDGTVVNGGNVSYLLNFSKEELDKRYPTTNIKVIEKSSLSSEDLLFSEPMSIVVRTIESKNLVCSRKESPVENIISTSFYLAMTAVLGTVGKKIMQKNRLEHYFKTIEKMSKPLSASEIIVLKERLKIRKETLALFLEQGETYER